jgi:hypothetical protein
MLTATLTKKVSFNWSGSTGKSLLRVYLQWDSCNISRQNRSSLVDRFDKSTWTQLRSHLLKYNNEMNGTTAFETHEKNLKVRRFQPDIDKLNKYYSRSSYTPFHKHMNMIRIEHSHT